jgi:NAD(P)-dependent dehydrogenase (short-subunit alcohol dehydrogenase family)
MLQPILAILASSIIMTKTILITGATDGIGLDAAKRLAAKGHTILLHGRSAAKLEAAKAAVGGTSTQTYLADLSSLSNVRMLANKVMKDHKKLDVLINNAGILNSANPITPDKLDVRFAVNTLAPYILTKSLLPLMDKTGRVVNISSAGQKPVSLQALKNGTPLSDFDAYSQSKLAIMMWTYYLSTIMDPMMVSVNPGSLLSTNMVKLAFSGAPPKDIGIGGEIICQAALSKAFANASGKYFDNDIGSFNAPHPDAVNLKKSKELVDCMDELVANFL